MIILGTLKSIRLRELLEHPLLGTLGRVSYSLYLVQVIALLCVAPWIVSTLNSIGISSQLPLQLILLAAMAGLCLILANMGEKWIEIPCIRLGQHITHYLERSSMVRKLKL